MQKYMGKSIYSSLPPKWMLVNQKTSWSHGQKYYYNVHQSIVAQIWSENSQLFSCTIIVIFCWFFLGLPVIAGRNILLLLNSTELQCTAMYCFVHSSKMTFQALHCPKKLTPIPNWTLPPICHLPSM